MSPVRLFAIALVWLGAAVAWLFLSGVIRERTEGSESRLENEVAGLWGREILQCAPRVSFAAPSPAPTLFGVGAAQAPKEPPPDASLRGEELLPDAAAVEVAIHLEPRRRGLFWYSTYSVEFQAAYRIVNPGSVEQAVGFHFDFPNRDAVYDDFAFSIGEEPYLGALDLARGLDASVRLKPGEAREVKVRYRSQGLGRWVYRFGERGARVRNFSLTLRTDFPDIDFPLGTLSPSQKETTPEGWKLAWNYTDLLSAADLGLLMPTPLNPGPLAAEIVAFGPLSLLFYFSVVVVLAILRAVPIHPMNYLFVAAAFFAFHLLFAYLVDHVSIHVAFALSAAVSLFLVSGYLRVVVGAGFAFREAGLAQVVFLVLFAYSFFLRGFTGLSVTIGSVVTLAVLMGATARVRWDEVFERRPKLLPRTPEPAGAP